MKRWLLWTFRCLRGRRCADVVVNAGELPVGTVGKLEYACANCGTHYRRTVIFGADGSFTHAERETVA